MAKNPELELAERRIQELEQKLQALSAADSKLHLLPNGDLHRGIRLDQSAAANIDVEVISEEFANPLNKAMAQVLKAAKGGHELTCLWCGLQFGGAGGESSLREHLKKDHPSVVSGWDAQATSQVLMANLEEATSRLAEKAK